MMLFLNNFSSDDLKVAIAGGTEQIANSTIDNLLTEMLETLGEGNPLTGVKIMAQLVLDGASFKEDSVVRTGGEKKEDAQASGVSKRTLGRYMGTKAFKGILSQLDKNRLEEILRWN